MTDVQAHRRAAREVLSRLALRARTAGRDEGTASVVVVVLSVALLAIAGLVVDGGRAINARAEAFDDAEQAARVGANQVDEALLRATGQVQVDPARAADQARAYLTARGYAAGDVTASSDGARVTVTVRDEVPTALLSLVFIQSIDVEGRAVARAAVGIDQEITPGAP